MASWVLKMNGVRRYLLGVIKILNNTLDEVFTTTQLAQVIKYSKHFELFQQSVTLV